MLCYAQKQIYYLEAGHIIEAGEFFNVSRLGVEASSMPRTADTTVTKVTLGQGCSVVGALVADGGKFAVLTDQERFGLTNVNLFHPAECILYN